ncbi:unnamed protein product [Polarella glacialis]|uniref:Uncharacterized protein n=1 Tax=Polarella glacialis TaxID=89957 RepID=A0A813HDU9_POLGL|nr:unnamed protein product [Polarella glacialis]
MSMPASAITAPSGQNPVVVVVVVVVVVWFLFSFLLLCVQKGDPPSLRCPANLANSRPLPPARATLTRRKVHLVGRQRLARQIVHACSLEFVQPAGLCFLIVSRIFQGSLLQQSCERAEAVRDHAVQQ